MHSCLLSLALLLTAVFPNIKADADDPETEVYDLVIYGGTSAAISAAVQANRMGMSVVIVSPDVHLGGLSSGGLGWTDFGRKDTVGGISREFYRRVKAHYEQPDAWIHQDPNDYRLWRPEEDAHWTFEPHVAEAIFEEFVAEHEIPVVRDAWLDRETGVERDGNRIVAITTLDGETYRGRIFLDTTYEGDLMAAAGVSFTVGREGNDQYGETLNGVQTRNAVSHQFELPVDPFVVEGDPSSGLLPRIHTGPPGEDGEGDHRVQAYCFRMCLTTVPENRVPFVRPEGYDPLQYELLGRYLRAGWDGVFRKFDPIPNLKTDTNNHGAFSTDNIGMNYDYPEASYERRREIIAEHDLYQKGLMYYLANDPGVPEPIRTEMSRWGLARDEFVENGHWPHQIYVREARRLISDFVMSERHLRGLEPTPDSIGMGSYNMDSHNVQRYVDENGHARNEGDIQVNPGGPYPISYRAIVPKVEECENLLVPVCLSSSHIAYGSIRMEPVFLVLGQSAATAAAIALDEAISVQAVPYEALQARLIDDDQVLDLPDSTANQPRVELRSEALDGIVIDDEQAELVGNWPLSTALRPYVDHGYRHDGAEGKGRKHAVFSADLEPGRFEVRLAYTPSSNRDAAVPVELTHADGTERLKVNQRRPPEHQGLFTTLGIYCFDGPARVEILTEGTTGHVVIDAVQFLPVADES